VLECAYALRACFTVWVVATWSVARDTATGVEPCTFHIAAVQGVQLQNACLCCDPGLLRFHVPPCKSCCAHGYNHVLGVFLGVMNSHPRSTVFDCEQDAAVAMRSLYQGIHHGLEIT
jgi:hypothetical protein